MAPSALCYLALPDDHAQDHAQDHAMRLPPSAAPTVHVDRGTRYHHPHHA